MKKTVATILLLASTLLPQLALAQTTDEKIADMRDALAHVIIALTQNGLLTTEIVNAVITEYNRRMAAIWGISEPLLPQVPVVTASAPAPEPVAKYCNLSSKVISYWKPTTAPEDSPGNPQDVELRWDTNDTGNATFMRMKWLGGFEAHIIDGVEVRIHFVDTSLPEWRAVKDVGVAKFPYYEYFGLRFDDGTTCYAKTTQ